VVHTASDSSSSAASTRPAEVVIAASAAAGPSALSPVVEAVRAAWPAGVRVTLCHAKEAVQQDEPAPADAHSLKIVPVALPAAARLPLTSPDAETLLRGLHDVADPLEARACAVLGSMPQHVTAGSVKTLVQPVLDGAADLVLAAYARGRLDGLINTGIVVPLTLALYGRRLDGQLGLDFAMSRPMLAALARASASSRYGRTIWPLSVAVASGLKPVQARLGTFLAPIEQTDVSAALVSVLGGLFDDMERHAAVWHRVRGSQAVPVSGNPPPHPDEPRALDVRPMIESFQVGVANLRDVWGLVLPPASLVELNRLARAPIDRFRLPDALWARLVFDFAVGHRLRVITREHLLRALTPAYLGWAASFALEVADLPAAAVRPRVQRLEAAFESEKPYLLARWRWPDRFHP
jgi:hypothetical protein